MIVYGDLAVQLNALNIATLSFFFTILIVTLVQPLVKPLELTYLINARYKGLWLIALMPWIVGVVSFISVLKLYATSESGSLFHFHHVFVFDAGSWHSITPILFTTLTLFAVIKSIFRLISHYRAAKALASFAGDKGVNEIDISSTHAFTSGFFRPKVYVSKGLLNNLENDEAKAVVDHEIAHQKRLDPLRKFIFSFFMSFFLPRTRKAMKSYFTLTQEQSADEYAANRAGDGTTVAMALLKATKSIRANSVTKHRLRMSEYCTFAGQEIRSRVNYLLEVDSTRKSFPYLLVLLMFVFFVAINFIGAGFFHHFTESLFNH